MNPNDMDQLSPPTDQTTLAPPEPYAPYTPPPAPRVPAPNTEHPAAPDSGTLRVALKELFGYDEFRPGQEEVVRALLLNFFPDHPSMAIQGGTTQEGGAPGLAGVAADIPSQRRDDRAMEQLMALVNDEPSVSSVSWEKAPPA